MSKPGVLLVNLGSPDSTAVSDVRKYLRQFLMDGRVIDVPFPIRWMIVNLAILPKRPIESAEAYASVWTDEGSPLVSMSRRLQGLLADRTGLPVELAMRYQNPSIEDAVDRIVEQGIDDLVMVPLFPHYAMSSYESAKVRVDEVMARKAPHIDYRTVPAFFDHPRYVEALVESSKPYLEKEHDHVLFSFHGLPQRHLIKSDPTGSHCLQSDDCCEGCHPAHEFCYKAQCHKTVAAFVEKAGIPADRHSTTFQSRLGKEPWIEPYTDKFIEELPGKGVKKLLVLCPAFVSDCLETLEEIGIRAKEDFVEAGGEELTLVPCMNDHPAWVDALADLVGEHFASSEMVA